VVLGLGQLTKILVISILGAGQQGDLLRKQVIENLESRLFFGPKCHILHGVNVTFLLAT